jgi:hypothetical protein
MIQRPQGGAHVHTCPLPGGLAAARVWEYVSPCGTCPLLTRVTNLREGAFDSRRIVAISPQQLPQVQLGAACGGMCHMRQGQGHAKAPPTWLPGHHGRAC